jgi:hypothetical protein
MAETNFDGAPSPEPVAPKPLDLTDPKYFPPMPTAPAKPHAQNRAELEAAGYELEAQSFGEVQPVARDDEPPLVRSAEKPKARPGTNK